MRKARYEHPQGVYRTSWGNAWFAEVQRQGRRYYLGTFDTVDEAVAARQTAIDHLDSVRPGPSSPPAA